MEPRSVINWSPGSGDLWSEYVASLGIFKAPQGLHQSGKYVTILASCGRV